MGYIQHDVVIVTGYAAPDYGKPAPDVAAFRESLPEEFRRLVVGPVDAVVNGYSTWLFLPDGSKSGWGTEIEAANYRQRFADLFSETYEDGSPYWDVVLVTYGADFRYERDQPVASYF